MRRWLLRGSTALAFSVAAVAAFAQRSDVTLGSLASDAGATNDVGNLTLGVDVLLAKLNREEQATLREQHATRDQLAVTRGRLVLRGRSYVRRARAGLLPAGLGFDALVEHSTQLQRLYQALQRDISSERQLLQNIAALERRLETLRERRAPLLEQQRATSQLSAAIGSAHDRALAFERAFSQSQGSGHTAIYGANVGPDDPTELRRGFAGLNGRLPFPLPGRTEIRVADRKAGDGPGLEMRAPAGTPVRAVFGGRVAFADEYADYGKSVIVDHGDGYFTVSAHLGEIDVAVGDDVGTGARLGSVRGEILYFEIRSGTQSLDPAEWFGI